MSEKDLNKQPPDDLAPTQSLPPRKAIVAAHNRPADTVLPATVARASAPLAAYAGADVAAYELVQAIMARQARRRGIFQAILFGTAIFACGGASGWGLAMLRGRTSAPSAQITPPAQIAPAGNIPERFPPSPDFPLRQPPIDQMVDRLRHELQLTDAQAGQITDIYQRCFAQLQAIRQQSMQPRYEEMRAEVEKVLTPDQFSQWDQRFRAMENQLLAPPRRRPPPRRDDDGEGPPPGP